MACVSHECVCVSKGDMSMRLLLSTYVSTSICTYSPEQEIAEFSQNNQKREAVSTPTDFSHHHQHSPQKTSHSLRQIKPRWLCLNKEFHVS